MAHDFTLASCTVYIWNPKGALRGLWGSAWGSEGTRVGHSAIRIGDGTENIYLSFWPEHAPKSSGINSYVRGYMQNTGAVDSFEANLDWAKRQKFSFDEDSDHEGTKSDLKFRFTAGLDWGAMITKAKQLRGEVNSYAFLKKNCTHAVANVLHAGNPPKKVPLTGTFTNTWQPSDLASYCKSLVIEINKTSPGYALAKVGAGVWL